MLSPNNYTTQLTQFPSLETEENDSSGLTQLNSSAAGGASVSTGIINSLFGNFFRNSSSGNNKSTENKALNEGIFILHNILFFAFKFLNKRG